MDDYLDVRFEFAIGQEVRIRPLRLNGTVVERADRGDWHDFKVIYWADSKRNEEWLRPNELESAA